MEANNEIGTFKLTLQFNEEYPTKPPVVRFVSKMFHPNGTRVSASCTSLTQCGMLSIFSVCGWTALP